MEDGGLEVVAEGSTRLWQGGVEMGVSQGMMEL
jgi:hypothetical protein